MPKIKNSLVETLCTLSPENFQQMWNAYNDDPKDVTRLGVMADVIDEVMPGNESAQQLSFACRWAMKHTIIPASNADRVTWKMTREKLDTPRTSHDMLGNVITIRYVRKNVKKRVGGKIKFYVLLRDSAGIPYPKTCRIPEVLRDGRGNYFTAIHKFRSPFEAIEWLGERLEKVRKIVNL